MSRLRFSTGILVLAILPSSGAPAAEAGFEPLFDGKSLTGWKGRSELWSVRDGAIVGSTKPDGLKHNTFLQSAKDYENFVLRLKFKFDGKGNSGVQLRSHPVGEGGSDGFRGYQADIGEGFFGSLYDEERRGMLVPARQDWVLRFIKLNEWNQYEMRVIGSRVTLTINGLVTARYEEKDEAIPRRGHLALQLHSGPAMEILFKDVEIQEIKPRKLLYVTTSAGFRHSSLPLSQKVLAKVGRDSGYFEVTATESTELLSPEGLKGFDAVAFYTTGDLGQFPLSAENRDYLISWVKEGHAFVGFHSATDTYKDWEPYWEMIGGSFNGHPWHEEVLIDVEDPTHPSVRHLDTQWTITDEIYQFKNHSRERLHVILSLNPSADKGKGQHKDKPDAEKDYPVAWCRDFGKGEVFYTSLGHREDVWTNPVYQRHVEGGILWALGVPGNEGDSTPGLPKTPAVFTPLFDGKTLSGWKALHDGKWDVADGVLSGHGGQGHLFSPKEYVNFHYKAEALITEASNSGMYFRTKMEESERWPRGMEAQVNSSHVDPVRTGSLYGLVKVFEQLIPPGEWGTQEIIAVGPYVVIKVNGQVTAAGKFPFDFKTHSPSGRFAFQQHHQGSEVKFRNVRVRELPGKVN